MGMGNTEAVRRRIPRRGGRIGAHAPLLVILIVAVAVFAHGYKPHPAVAAEPVSGQAGSEKAARVDWDSIYTAIQHGFTAVRPILEKGCFDCHSTKTYYPWYYRIPIIKGEIDSDIRRARKRLDMTNGFPFRGYGFPAGDLDAIRDEITSGDMPPWGYRIFHWNARPSRAEADSVYAWIGRSLALLAAHGQYPAGEPQAAPDSIRTSQSGSGK